MERMNTTAERRLTSAHAGLMDRGPLQLNERCAWGVALLVLAGCVGDLPSDGLSAAGTGGMTPGAAMMSTATPSGNMPDVAREQPPGNADSMTADPPPATPEPDRSSPPETDGAASDQTNRMRPAGQPDTWLYHGSCPIEMDAENGVLANDNLEADLRTALAQRQVGFEVIIGGPDAGLFAVRPDGFMRFRAPTERIGQTFQASYTIITPWGASAPIQLTVQPGPNELVVAPLAPDNVLGDGQCSLREAIQHAGQRVNSEDCGPLDAGPVTIVFNDTGEIKLNGLEGTNAEPIGMLPHQGIVVESEVRVIGCGTSSHIINAQNQGRIFNITPNGRLTVEHLSLRQGRASLGGAILNAGYLKLSHVEAVSNQATGPSGEPSLCRPSGSGGGGLAAGGFLAMIEDAETIMTGADTSCRIEQNTAQGGDGGEHRGGLCTDGGSGGGFRGGQGGDGAALQSSAWQGGDGGFGSGGGGGGGSTLRTVSNMAAGRQEPPGGDGGRGGWGGGGGGTALGQGTQNGTAGFAGGAGASRDRRAGVGGGGGALGGAVVVFGGRLTITGCTLAGNRVVAGQGGRLDNQTIGNTGAQYGADIFRVHGTIDVDDPVTLQINHCIDVSDAPDQDCRPWTQLLSN
ncbi:MAG: hypothetical protein VX589_06560 [Myxococcota bacterium]|nr:hypothetical protein [Myxococcota bacterium]